MALSWASFAFTRPLPDGIRSTEAVCSTDCVVPRLGTSFSTDSVKIAILSISKGLVLTDHPKIKRKLEKPVAVWLSSCTVKMASSVCWRRAESQCSSSVCHYCKAWSCLDAFLMAAVISMPCEISLKEVLESRNSSLSARLPFASLGTRGLSVALVVWGRDCPQCSSVLSTQQPQLTSSQPLLHVASNPATGYSSIHKRFHSALFRITLCMRRVYLVA